MAPSVEDPDSWTEYADLDLKLQQLLDLGAIKPRFVGDTSAPLPEIRERYRVLFQKDAETARSSFSSQVHEEEFLIPTRDGTHNRALFYRPIDADTAGPGGGRPLIVMIHGGGFVLGTPEMETPLCMDVAATYGCVCVSISYRLSPEVRFPVAYEDCWDSVTWLALNAESMGADPTQGFILGGCSAGAHVSIPLSHRARDEGLSPPLTGVYLSAPPSIAPQAVTDEYRPYLRSREQLSEGIGLTKESSKLYDDSVRPVFDSPLWSPLLWPTGHASLPPTFLQICGGDALRDEGLLYERELRVNNGNTTRVVMYNGLPHIFWYNFPDYEASEQYHKDAVKGCGWLLGKEA